MSKFADHSRLLRISIPVLDKESRKFSIWRISLFLYLKAIFHSKSHWYSKYIFLKRGKCPVHLMIKSGVNLKQSNKVKTTFVLGATVTAWIWNKCSVVFLKRVVSYAWESSKQLYHKSGFYSSSMILQCVRKTFISNFMSYVHILIICNLNWWP